MAFSLKTVNGVSLETLAWGLEVGTSPTSMLPGRRTADIVVPGRVGVVRAPFEPFESTDFALSMWVMGTRPDGTLPSGRTPMEGVEANLQRLLSLFSAPTLNVVRVVDGVESSANVRVVAASSPNFGTVGTLGRFTVVLSNPDTYWTETKDTTVTRALASPARVRLAEFAGTQPITDAVVTVVGPAPSPRLTDVASGATVYLPRQLATGETWRLDCAAWTSRVSSNGFTVSVRPERNRASSLFQISSRVEAASGDLTYPVDVDLPAGTVTITGRRRFL